MVEALEESREGSSVTSNILRSTRDLIYSRSPKPLSNSSKPDSDRELKSYSRVDWQKSRRACFELRRGRKR